MGKVRPIEESKERGRKENTRDARRKDPGEHRL
jgi:hypothetical protein